MRRLVFTAFWAVAPALAFGQQPQIRVIGESRPLEQRQLGEVYHAASSSQVIRSISAEGDALLAGRVQPRMVRVGSELQASQSTPVRNRQGNSSAVARRMNMSSTTPQPARGSSGGRLFSLSTYSDTIQRAAHRHGVEEALVRAVIHAESAYKSTAVSRAGAAGLMQLMPGTAKRFGVSNRFDPTQNIHGGTEYLGWLMRRYNGNVTLATAAYNAGEGAVDRYGGVPPYRETQNYVKRVGSLLWQYRDAMRYGVNDGLPSNARPITGVGYAAAIRTISSEM